MRDTYVPAIGVIREIRDLTENIRWFKIELDEPLGHRPGQFVMVSLFGVGEIAISITSKPSHDNFFEMAIRQAGNVTTHIRQKKVGDELGIRGPFGNGFTVSDFYGKDMLFVCGGLGLVPLRSLIVPVVEEREKFGNIHIVCGFRSPKDSLYEEEINAWGEFDNVEVYPMVDSTSGFPWAHGIGLVTEAIPGISLNQKNCAAVLCGPPVMYKFVMLELMKKGLSSEQIFVDLERRMHCGVGICGHCQIEHLYCCQEGPVFRFSDIARMREAL